MTTYKEVILIKLAALEDAAKALQRLIANYDRSLEAEGIQALEEYDIILDTQIADLEELYSKETRHE